MTDRIGRADYELRGDQSGLVNDLQSAEGKITQSGARVEKSAAGTGLAFKAAAATAAVGFGLMTKGAVEMEGAQGKFMAATGKSREEAVAFSKDMNGLVGTAGTVGMSFEKITDAGVEVARQFQVEGDEARDLTADMLAFSKVTGQDAVAATMGLEDALSAYGMEAGDAAGIMDILVASNQRFGTDAGPATLAVLQGMAPALQAMGADMGDGIALLNAFEVAGVDASAAQRGLNTAITELPEGQTLEGFLDHLQDLKNRGIDPTSEAIEVFGNKAGAALALTLKPGGNALDDFRVSAEDAAGAVDQAAEDMLTTGDKIRMFAEKAGSALRGLGQDLGPMLSGLGGVATLAAALPNNLTKPLTDGLKAVWGRVATSLPVKAAVGAASAAAGAVYSVGLKIGETLGTAVSAAWSRLGMSSSSTMKASSMAGRAAGVAFGVAAAAGAIFIGADLGRQFWRAVVETPDEVKRDIDASLEHLFSDSVNKLMPDDMKQRLRDEFTIAVMGAYNAGADELTALIEGDKVAQLLVAKWQKGIHDETPELVAAFDEAWTRAVDAGNSYGKATEIAMQAIEGMIDVTTLNAPRVGQAAAEITATTYAEYLDQFWASGRYGPPLPEEMWVAAGADVGEASAAALGNSFSDYLRIFRESGQVGLPFTYEEWRTAAYDAGINTVADGFGPGFNRGMDEAQDATAARWIAMAEFYQGVARAAFLKVGYDLGTAVPSSIGQGMADESRQLVDAADNLKDILENGLSPDEQKMKVLTGKWIKLFRNGITSEIPGAREATFRLGVEGLEALSQGTIGTDEAKRIAQIAGGLYADGWDSRQTMVALAAQGVGEEALRELARVAGWDDAAVDDAIAYINGIESQENAAENAGEDLGGAAYDAATDQPWNTGGSNSAGSWVSGFANKIDNKTSFLMRKLDGIAGAYQGFSPPKWGPLKDLDKGAGRVAQSWVDGFAGPIEKGVGRVQGLLHRYRPALSLASPEFGLGSMSGVGVTRSTTVNVGGITIPVTVTGGGDPDAIGTSVADKVREVLDDVFDVAERGSGLRWSEA